jgi:Ca2+-binding EF-hand superfamily protein
MMVKKKTEIMVNLGKIDSERYHELFRKLDIDSDGKIDVNDLVFLFGKSKDNKEDNLKRAKVSDSFIIGLVIDNLSVALMTQELIQKVDHEAIGALNFADFVRYMIDHENRLELVFRGIDTNNDSKLKKILLTFA